MSHTSPSQENPYIVGRPVEGVTLYGREDVFTFVHDTLAASKQNAVVLYGQRRAGKTSILHELPRRLPKEKFHTTFFDLQGQATLELAVVLHNLAEAIAESLNITPPDEEHFKKNREYFQKDFLPEIWKILDNRRLLLLFDEFEIPSESEDSVIKDRAEQEFYPFMRDLMDKEKRLSFVFVVGRRIDDLTHWVKRVFKEAQYKKIGLLMKSEAANLIQKPAENILHYEEDAIEAILNLTSGHPFFTQLICHEIFNYAQNSKANMISATDVMAIVEPALESGKPAFVWLWDALSISGRIYLAAVAYIRAKNKKANKKTIQEALNRFRIRPGADWNSVPRELAEWDVLQDDPSNIKFVVKLMELWVRTSHTLREVKATLMQENETDFKEARKLAQQGDFELAVKAFRDILTANPNHLGAQLALAQTLLDQKKLKEAVEAFEDAFWLDEDVGRDGLIDARLAMAQALEDQAQFLEAAVHYRRVLELKPDEYRVQEKLRILYDQGRKAAAAGAWEQAAHSFERVTDIDRNYKDAHDRRDAAYRQLEATTTAKKSQATSAPTVPPAAQRSLASIIGMTAIILIFLGGVSIGGWLIWTGGFTQTTPTPTQAIVSNTTPTTSPTAEPTAEPIVEPTQEPTGEPTAEPTVEPTQEPIVEPTSEPTQEPTGEPTAEPTVEPTREPTLTPTFTPTASNTPTPIVVTATPTPTPPLPSYPQPQLISPPDYVPGTEEGRFTGPFDQPRLEWASVGELGPNDFYVVTVTYPKGAITEFGGASVKNTFWDVDPNFYNDITSSDREFRWSVIVSHFEDRRETPQGTFEPIGEGIEVSQRSEERIFRWE